MWYLRSLPISFPFSMLCTILLFFMLPSLSLSSHLPSFSSTPTSKMHHFSSSLFWCLKSLWYGIVFYGSWYCYIKTEWFLSVRPISRIFNLKSGIFSSFFLSKAVFTSTNSIIEIYPSPLLSKLLKHSFTWVNFQCLTMCVNFQNFFLCAQWLNEQLTSM